MKSGSGILRYREDRWPLAYTLMVLAVQLGLFFGVGNLWITALCVILFQPVQAVAIACNHYQHHINIFRSRGLNRIYELILFLQTGTPPYLITLHHNLGHHPHYLEPEPNSTASFAIGFRSISDNPTVCVLLRPYRASSPAMMPQRGDGHSGIDSLQ